MTLNAELKAFRSCMLDRVTPHEAKQVCAVEQEMIAAELGRNAPRLGDVAPDFTLADQMGRETSLHGLLRDGPVILNFYRGNWCPFCMITLRAMQRQVAAVRGIPASIIAISPQDAATALATAETHGIGYPLLSDPNKTVGRAWNLMYELPAPIRPLYERLGHALPKLNACGSWAVPMTAGYVIAPDGRIVHAHLDPRPHVRMEPTEAVSVARRHAAAQAA